MNLVIVVLFITIALCGLSVNEVRGDDDPIIKRAIIYDKKTPNVFYCPLEEYNGVDNMLVKARPLNKLCEYAGEGLPEGYQSDCWKDVDESDFACKERRRIMKRRQPPGIEALDKYNPIPREVRAANYRLAFSKKV